MPDVRFWICYNGNAQMCELTNHPYSRIAVFGNQIKGVDG
jgi:hypothetical protein